MKATLISESIDYQKRDKYKITSWNKEHIPMDKFLSFLSEDLKSETGLGSDNGWTYRTGKDNLRVQGGFFNGVEYLHNIQYKAKLANVYNNFVDPFYIWDLLSKEGQEFFLDYYKKEIQDGVDLLSGKISRTFESLQGLKTQRKELKTLVQKLK